MWLRCPPGPARGLSGAHRPWAVFLEGQSPLAGERAAHVQADVPCAESPQVLHSNFLTFETPQSTSQSITLTMSPRTAYTFHLKPLKFTSQDNDTILPCPSETAFPPLEAHSDPSHPRASSPLSSFPTSPATILPFSCSHPTQLPQPTIGNTQHNMFFLCLKPSHWELREWGLWTCYSPLHPPFTPSGGHRPPELPSGSHLVHRAG